MATSPQSQSLTALLDADFLKSGLTAADRKRLGVRPVTVAECLKLPGLAPGIVHQPGAAYIPYFGIEGPTEMYRLRLYGSGGFAAGVGIKPQKYVQPSGIACPPYFSPLLDWRKIAKDTTREIWITEGEKKSASCSKMGQPCIGIGGVWNFKTKDSVLHPAFLDIVWEGRTVVIVCDSDWSTNHNVRNACDSLARALTSEGAQVFLVTIPPLPGLEKTGLDDVIVANGAAALALLRQHIRPWVDAPQNDTGNAAIFQHLSADRLFWALDIRKNHWRYWNGKFWEESEERALQLTRDVPTKLRLDAATIKDEEARKQALGWAKQSGNVSRRDAMLRLAKSEMDKKVSELDADPYLFNLQDGVLNLQTFEVNQHDSRLMLSRISPARFDPKAKCPAFVKFINRILPDRSVRDFIQVLCGVFLLGSNPDRIFVNFYGDGANGKTQLKELLLYLGGVNYADHEYARTCPADTFLAGRRAGAPRDDIHALRGVRLAVATEISKGAVADEAMIKEITGGDTIATRALYGRHQNWKPSFTPLLVSNAKLVIHGTDSGIWDRLVIVPFNERIPEKERIPDMWKKHLLPELSGFLNWSLEGLRQYWQVGKLYIPDAVREMGKAHREESDVVSHFINDCCEKAPSAKLKDCVSADALNLAFTEYCIRRRISAKSIDLPARMKQLNYEQRRSDRLYWLGLTLRITGHKF